MLENKQKIFYNTLCGIILFEFIFDDSCDLQKLDTYVENGMNIFFCVFIFLVTS